MLQGVWGTADGSEYEEIHTMNQGIIDHPRIQGVILALEFDKKRELPGRPDPPKRPDGTVISGETKYHSRLEKHNPEAQKLMEGRIAGTAALQLPTSEKIHHYIILEVDPEPASEELSPLPTRESGLTYKIYLKVFCPVVDELIPHCAPRCRIFKVTTTIPGTMSWWRFLTGVV